MTTTLRQAIAGLVAAGALTLAGAAPALAGTGPVNAPTAVTGTFVCTNAANGTYVASGTYVINAGHANVQTWDAAILTFDSGGTGVFIQNAQAIVTPTPVTKGSATPGPLQCSIQSPPGTAIGTVWGKIVITG
jgi:hypothetical protein